ncbi:MAG: ATP synthase subunit C [Nitrososphaerales archaeon]
MRKKTSKKFLLISVTSALILLALSSIPLSFAQSSQEGELGLMVIGACIAAALAFFAAGIGLGMAGSAAMGAISEKPEIFSMTFIYIVFIEAIAIYGLVVVFMILARL